MGTSETVFQDVRYGLRFLRKKPMFTAAALITLALGIGANTAIFSLIDAVLLRTLPYRDPDRLVIVSESLPKMDASDVGVSAAEYQDYRNQNHSFSQIAAFESDEFNLTGANEPRRVNAARVSASLFPMLGISPELGRPFTEEEDNFGATRVVILSHALWRYAYGGDPKILGKSVKLNEELYTVVGVMPQSFRFPSDGAPLSERTDLWVPEAFDPVRLSADNRINEFGVGVLARVKHDVHLKQVQGDIQKIADEFMQRYGYSGNIRVVPRAYPFAAHNTENARTLLLLLGLAVAAVLLIACSNVANMQLARAARRYREISIRIAVGASRVRILRQCLLESAVLSVGGALLGIVVAEALILGFSRFGPADVPRLQEVRLDPITLAFTLALSLISAIGFGFAPAWRLSRAAPVMVLRETAPVGHGRGTRTLHDFVAVFQIAAALVLLLSGGLLLKSFVRLVRSPSGFDPNNAFVFRTIFNHARYPDSAKRVTVQKQILEGVQHLPGVVAVAEASHLPLSDSRQIGFRLENDNPEDFHSAENSLVTPRYFYTMGITLLKGRDFTLADDSAASLVAIVNETLARRYFPGKDPLGRQLQWGDRGKFTIIGVAADVRISALDADPPPMIYYSLFQVESGASSRTALIIRSDGAAQGLVDSVRKQIWSLDADLPIYQSTTFEALVSESLAQRRFTVFLLGTFAVIGLTLAGVGIFGVVSYAVAERTREFGVRMAFGADRWNIHWHVMVPVAVMSLCGCGLGLILSLFASRALQSSLYRVNRFDFLTTALVIGALFGTSLLAGYGPARRAAKVDPMLALRYE